MNFIEIDRSILKSIGFKNTFSEEKDKNGNLKIDDETGNPKLMDNRHDFKSATRSLRRRGFKEGTCFADPNAHFVIKKVKVSSNNQRGGHNKQSIWVRSDKLEEWITIARHSPHFTKKNENGLVYFVHQEGDFQRFKIGYTTNLADRLQTLQIGTPDLLVVYKTIKNVTQAKEKQLHQLFAPYHIRGEWFSISTDMIDPL